MELKIKVICEGLPCTEFPDMIGGDSVAGQQLHLGIQRGDEVVEAVAVNRKQIVFEPGFDVSPLPDGKTNFLGPYAQGTPKQRFFYLSGVMPGKDGTLIMLGRAKIHLSHLVWSQVEGSIRSGV